MHLITENMLRSDSDLQLGGLESMRRIKKYRRPECHEKHICSVQYKLNYKQKSFLNGDPTKINKNS